MGLQKSNDSSLRSHFAFASTSKFACAGLLGVNSELCFPSKTLFPLSIDYSSSENLKSRLFVRSTICFLFFTFFPCLGYLNQLWWIHGGSLLGAAIPAVIAGQAMRMKKRKAEEQRLRRTRGRKENS